MWLRRAAIVPMVQTADLWTGHDWADRWRCDWPGSRRVLGQREMGPRLAVVRQIPGQDAR